MTITAKHPAVCVLTARGFDTILAEGGSQAWVLDAKRARECEYVVCIQNRGFVDDWGKATAPHHTAFLVGRIKDVTKSTEEGNEERWILQFSHYAEINIPEAWPGHRNPVFYTDLESMGIKFKDLEFVDMPAVENRPAGSGSSDLAPLTIAQAKERLALTLGVDPSCIDITIRA